MSRIDRIYLAAPRWFLVQSEQRFSCLADALDLNERCVSDHAPVAVTTGPRLRMQTTSQPIQPHIFKHPRFAPMFAAYTKGIDWEKLAPPEKYELLVTILRASGEKNVACSAVLPHLSPSICL